jgi:hypothetical protein
MALPNLISSFNILKISQALQFKLLSHITSPRYLLGIMESNQSRRFYLISFPRSGLNLLVRILGLQQQPNVVSRQSGGYFFMPTVMLSLKINTWAKPVSSWTLEQRNAMTESYQNGFNELQALGDIATTQDKLLFVKEHSELALSKNECLRKSSR